MRKTMITLIMCSLSLTGCGPWRSANENTDSIVAREQEVQHREAHAQVGTARITNWNEMRMLRLVQEMRDHPNLATWTYNINMNGRYSLVCESIGYGIPYDTRSNNPEHFEFVTTRSGWRTNSCNYNDSTGACLTGEYHVMPQPEPNGLYIPESAHGTWNLCRNPRDGRLHVTYQEQDVAVFPYQLPDQLVEGYTGTDSHARLTAEEQRRGLSPTARPSEQPARH